MEKRIDILIKSMIMINIFLILTNVITLVSITDVKISKANIKNYEVAEGQQTTVPSGYIGIYKAMDLTKIKLDGKYILMEDIDMTEFLKTRAYSPIGANSTSMFTGVFDGNFHTISNISMTSSGTQYLGMFGYTKNAIIKNLTLENASLYNRYKTAEDTCYIGAIVGYSNRTTIENVKVSGKISNTYEFSGKACQGGIVGYQESGTIDGAISQVSVSASIDDVIWLGGIAGISEGKITNSCATGEIKGKSTQLAGATSTYIGGLVGRTYGTIESSCFTGKVISESEREKGIFIGGLVGAATAYGEELKIKNCYSTGTVEAINGWAGGLIGEFCGDSDAKKYASLINCYSVGTVLEGTLKGALIGKDIEYTDIVCSYWNSETAGTSKDNAIGSQSKTTEEMLYKETFETWDFDTIWKIDEGYTYPYLRNMEMPGSVVVKEKEKANITVVAYEKLNGVETEEPVKGVNVVLYKCKQELEHRRLDLIAEKKTEDNGQVLFENLEPGEYAYEVLGTPSGYSYHGKLYDVTVDDNGTVVFGENAITNEEKTMGIIYIEKVTADKKSEIRVATYKKLNGVETEEPVKGAVVALYRGEEEIGRETTGDNGKVVFENIEKGTYTYKEVSAPSGYKVNTTVYNVTVDDNGAVVFGENAVTNEEKTVGIIYNEKEKANITVVAYEKLNGVETEEPVKGAKIELYKLELDAESHLINANKIAEKITGDNGQVIFENLESGTYVYEEKSTPSGYKVNTTVYNVTVDDNGKVVFGENAVTNEEKTVGIIYNEKVTANITVVAYEKLNGVETKEPVKGAVVGLYKCISETEQFVEYRIIEEKTTGDNGQVVFENLVTGRYLYVEERAPSGYKINTTTNYVTIDDNGTVVFGEYAVTNEEKTMGIIYNEKVTANIRIVTYKELNGVETEETLRGVNVLLYKRKQELENGRLDLIAEKKTEDNGQVVFENLEPGRYAYQVLVAPSGYRYHGKLYEVTVDNNGTVVFEENAITNKEKTMGIVYIDRITANIRIQVTDKEPRIYTNKKVRMPLAYVVNGTKNEITESNERAVIGLYSEGKEIRRETAEENGQVIFTGVEPGAYTYKEIEASVGSIEDNKEYEVTVTDEGTVKFGEGVITNEDGTMAIMYNEKINETDKKEEQNTSNKPQNSVETNKKEEQNISNKPQNSIKTEKNVSYLPKAGGNLILKVLLLLGESICLICAVFKVCTMKKD